SKHLSPLVRAFIELAEKRLHAADARNVLPDMA
ncbi:hypothetical protein H4W29_004207, partial [Rhizobium viscosum]|nr:hypothetical protein [Rhizobium viscosum]